MKNHVIFISGGARGVGASLVTFALKDGNFVFCASRGGRRPIGIDSPMCKTCKLDVTDYSSCENSIRECISYFGRIDVLVNNASGYFGGKPIGEYTSSAIRSEIETTLMGTIFLTNAFASIASRPDRRQYIVNISSISGLGRESGNGMHCVYAAAKAGIIRFTEASNETLRCNNTSAHVIIPNNIRKDNLIDQGAVSEHDVYSAIRFLTQSCDNLYVDQLVLNPFRVNPSE